MVKRNRTCKRIELLRVSEHGRICRRLDDGTAAGQDDHILTPHIHVIGGAAQRRAQGGGGFFAQYPVKRTIGRVEIATLIEVDKRLARIASAIFIVIHPSLTHVGGNTVGVYTLTARGHVTIAIRVGESFFTNSISQYADASIARTRLGAGEGDIAGTVGRSAGAPHLRAFRNEIDCRSVSGWIAEVVRQIYGQGGGSAVVIPSFNRMC